MSQLLPLFVAVPLAAAGLLVVLRGPLPERAVLIAVPMASGLGGLSLLLTHVSTPVLAHAVGSYVPGVAIVFASDSLSALLLTIIGLLTAVACAFLMRTGEDRYRFVAPLTMMLLTGANGALLTGDLFNLFVFVEVMLLPSYVLTAVTGYWRRLGVGRMFVIVNLLASTLLVMGVGLVYGAAGTVNLAALARAADSNPQVALAGGVIIFAMLVKAGVVPMHGWLPRSYPATSAGVMALFSGIHTKIGLYAVYRVFATLYGGTSPALPVLVALAVASIVVGSLGTFGEQRIRGALAYQMVAGVGQILIGIVVFTRLSVSAGLFYMVHHMIVMGALVLASGAIEHVYGTGRFDRLSGLLKREPAVAVVFALGFLALVGLPPTSGLWGKAFLLGGAAQADPVTAWALIGAVVLASIVSLMALQRVWHEVFNGPPMSKYYPDDPATARGDLTPISDDTRTRLGDTWPSLVLIGLSVALFIGVGLVWPFFDRAATALLDLAPYLEAVRNA